MESSITTRSYGAAADAVIAARQRPSTTLADVRELSALASRDGSPGALVALAGACIDLAARQTA